MQMKKDSLKAMVPSLVGVVFACLTVAVFAAAGVVEEVAQTMAGERQLPIYYVETDEKRIALTFDAAWEHSDTKELIALLRENDVKATFFATGDWVERCPEDVKKLREAGHEIQNHSDTHPHPNELTAEELIKDTAACDEKLRAITGETPTLYRAPYGEYNDTVIRTLHSLGKQVIQWNVDSLDWKDPSPEEMENRVLSRAEKGSILLFHTDTKNTPAALRKILPALREKGFTVGTVSELLPEGSFALNNQGGLVKQGS